MKSFVLALALAAGCAHAPPAPAGALEAGGVARLYCVDAPACTIYRSAQPTAAQFSVLVARYGLRSVVKLNDSLPFDGGQDEVPGGVTVFMHRWLPAGPVDHDDVAAALDTLERAPRPVLVHCSHGVDRTGLLIALWRVRHGALPVAAWGEWRAFGRDESLVLFSDAFERETGYRP